MAFAALAACGGLFAPGPADAARPMATDDTGTAAAGDCQIEAWGDRLRGAWDGTVAPVCGLTDELELDTSFSQGRVERTGVNAAGLGLKWVPAAARVQTAAGEMRFGAIAFAEAARSSGGNWRGEMAGLAALASLTPVPQLSLYLNAYGLQKRGASGVRAGARAAAAWTPDEHWVLFVEGLAAEGTKPVANAGLRRWLVPDRFGLDLVATRSADGWGMSLGLGWYGISVR